MANALRTEIAKGRWDTVLPGYRKLQEYFGIGRPAAIEFLHRTPSTAVDLHQGVYE